jgi:hypothetical protein
MKNAQALSRLEEIIRPDLPALESTAIIPDGRHYIVFGRYRIQRDPGSVSVLRYGNSMGEFTMVKSALAWCIADKLGQMHLADDIHRLEQQRALVIADLETRSNLASKIRDLRLAESVEAKLETRKQRLKDLNSRLTKCINLAKYWQTRGFNNETARTGRPASHRKNH